MKYTDFMKMVLAEKLKDYPLYSQENEKSPIISAVLYDCF